MSMNVAISEQILADILLLEPESMMNADADASSFFKSSFDNFLSVLDESNFWSLELCNRSMYLNLLRLGIDPWEVLKNLTSFLPNTQGMLSFEGQYLFGDRRYSNDAVHKFVTKAVSLGVEVFSIGDPMNQLGNLQGSIQSINAHKKHAQAVLFYANKTIDYYLELVQSLIYLNVDSICIVASQGELRPYQAHELIYALKQKTELPIYLKTDDLDFSLPNSIKAIEAGVDGIMTRQLASYFKLGGTSIGVLHHVFAGSNREPNIKEASHKSLLESVDQLNLKHKVSEKDEDDLCLETVSHLNESELVDLFYQERCVGSSHKLLSFYVDEIQNDLGDIPLQMPVVAYVIEQAVMHMQGAENYKTLVPNFIKLCQGHYGDVDIRSERLKKQILNFDEEVPYSLVNLAVDEYDLLATKLKNAILNIRLKECFTDLSQTQKFDDFIFNYAFAADSTLHLLSESVSSELLDNENLAADAVSEDSLTINAPSEDFVVATKNEQQELEANIEHFFDGDSSVVEEVIVEEFYSPVSGVVQKVFCMEGSVFEKGELLLIVNVLHMNIKVFAEKSGAVNACFVKDNEFIAMNQSLYRMEYAL